METENKQADKANGFFFFIFFDLEAAASLQSVHQLQTSMKGYKRDHAKDHCSTPKMKTQEGPNAWFGPLLAQRRDTFDCWRQEYLSIAYLEPM